MDKRSIKLGDHVRCEITGFSGIAVSTTTWLYGCVRIGVLATEMKDGIPHDVVWFDEAQLRVTDEVHNEEVPTDDENNLSIGGPSREGRAGDPSASRPGEL
jgi:hypothetical protein